MYKYVLHYYSPKAGQEARIGNSITTLKRSIPKDATYYDISKGVNLTEVENLVEWGGKGGYWSNKVTLYNEFGTSLRLNEVNNVLKKRKF